MPSRKKACLSFFSFILIISLLAACGGANSNEGAADGSGNTPTPTATIDPSGYQAVASRSCLVNEWNTLQSEQRRGQAVNWIQGDLLAWRPGGTVERGELAFLAPGSRSSWFTGELTLASGMNYADHISLAPGVLANGDLTWSPEGTWLAFLAYRPNETIYTVMAVMADGSGLIDLFPTDLARTDNRSSQKAIVGWRSDTTVQVMVSCGEECRQAFDIDVTKPSNSLLIPTPVDDYTLLKQNLQISQQVQTITPDAFPKNMRVTPSIPSLSPIKWAPDGRQAAYLDRRGILWNLSLDEKINYILDIGLRDVYELQWSTTSDTLAIRAEDRVFLFQVPCREN
ncbi:MAG: PD40 domain-containing protein [Anaerolineaceae bacterium]|nr:PD40 domain-containing protein [Anaerolineaceae bacterium]